MEQLLLPAQKCNWRSLVVHTRWPDCLLPLSVTGVCLQVGEGSIAALSTGGAVSKFGFPLQVSDYPCLVVGCRWDAPFT